MTNVLYSHDFTKFLSEEVMVVYTLQRVVKITSTKEQKVFREIPGNKVTDDQIVSACKELHKQLMTGQNENPEN